MHTLIGALIFLITIGLIMVRPRRVTEAIAAAAGLLSACCFASKIGFHAWIGSVEGAVAIWQPIEVTNH